MSAAALLLDLERLGIRLEARGDRLRYSPRSALTPDLLNRLKAHKQELLTVLRAPVNRLAQPVMNTRDCSHDAAPVLRPTVQGDRLFCPSCSRRVGRDEPFPW